MKQATERILTLHPAGKRGTRIARDKYEVMKLALLKAIPRGRAGVPFRELAERVRPHLDPAVYGAGDSVTWYVVTVKQDLEARGLVEQVPGKGPQRLRRAGSGR